MSGLYIFERLSNLFKKNEQLTHEDLQLLRSIEQPKDPNPALAYALVLLNAAGADNEIHEAERASIASILTKKLEVPARDTEILLRQAGELLRSGAGLEIFSSYLRGSLSLEEKQMMLQRVKGIVEADGFVSPIEEQVVVRVAALLDIPYE